MKTNHAKRNARPLSGIRPTRLEFTHPTAATVRIAGSFNDWRPGATPMVPLGEGRWAKALALPPGRYEYCVVVDGEYQPDPQASQTAPNPFGGVNSVLNVEAPAGTNHRDRPRRSQRRSRRV